LIRLAIRVKREQAELVLAELLELVPAGVEEVSDGDVVEYGVYGAPGELPALPDLKAAAGGALVEIATSEVADDWPARWRAYHRPVVVADRLTVRPPWEAPASTLLEVVIDPGRAFGTGAHATTRLCLELLLELDPAGNFMDLGCGSGVLAIAAARLGFVPVLALDNDLAALEATKANAAANGVEVEMRRFDLRAELLPAARTVAANLLAPLFRRWAPQLAATGCTPDRVIAGGLLAPEADSVAAEFAAAGLNEMKRRESGGWVALLLERASG
jgi:ribosomal protein L11 methyltransferase